MQAIIEARAAKFAVASGERPSAARRPCATTLPRQADSQGVAGEGGVLRRFLDALRTALSGWAV
jgi:hypothetical protein